MTYIKRELASGSDEQETALATWKLFNCRDAGRVDLRFDKNGPDGVPNVLEVNPIAGLEKDESLLPMTAKLRGLEFTGLIEQIVESAMLRRREVTNHK